MKPLDIINNISNIWKDIDSRTRLLSGYILIVLLAIAVGWSALSSKVEEVEKKRVAREEVLKELLPLKATYLSAKQISGELNSKMATLRSDDSPAKIVEDIGIKGKTLKIVPLKSEERSGFTEDAADIRIESLTLNEAINLIYRLEKSSRPLLIKKSNLRIRFDDPSHCDLNIIMSLLRPVRGEAR
ncbi:MAG: general secretion pathway protein GspM [Desulfuromonadaceae bacterium]|nr:general secretion pathway protein GspM [Desulfuromonadaceae bacterium]MDD2854268.1 general secretion pathway protein GspM [Desulfuromonadaceae bacterium]